MIDQINVRPISNGSPIEPGAEFMPTSSGPDPAQNLRKAGPSLAVSIIENDAATRLMLTSWLRQTSSFHSVGNYSSAERALAAVPAEKPAVVLVATQLPGLSGIECVRRLRPLLPTTQFIMFTSDEDVGHIFSALAAGASGYLLKSTSRRDLLAAIQQVHEGGAPMTGSIARKVIQSFQQPRADKLHRDVESLLSLRQQEMLLLLARGFAYKEIAHACAISVSTVNTHIRRIYEKLAVRSRAQAVAILQANTRHGTPGF